VDSDAVRAAACDAHDEARLAQRRIAIAEANLASQDETLQIVRQAVSNGVVVMRAGAFLHRELALMKRLAGQVIVGFSASWTVMVKVHLATFSWLSNASQVTSVVPIGIRTPSSLSDATGGAGWRSSVAASHWR
jgi:hypothetical protein